jgi:hypothetical protein
MAITSTGRRLATATATSADNLLSLCVTTLLYPRHSIHAECAHDTRGRHHQLRLEFAGANRRGRRDQFIQDEVEKVRPCRRGASMRSVRQRGLAVQRPRAPHWNQRRIFVDTGLLLPRRAGRHVPGEPALIW